jgi:hypothetical protein
MAPQQRPPAGTPATSTGHRGGGGSGGTSKLASAAAAARASGAFLANAVVQTGGEIRRSPCLYCVGLTATFLTVLVAAVVQTLLARAPLIFLREAEAARGQVDVSITPAGGGGNGFLNYSQFASSLAGAASAPAYAFHSPRLRLTLAEVYTGQACTAPPPTARPLAAAVALAVWADDPLTTCARNAAAVNASAASPGAAAGGYIPSGSAAAWMYRHPAPLNASDPEWADAPPALSGGSPQLFPPSSPLGDGLGPLCGSGPCLQWWCLARGPFGAGQIKQPLRYATLLLVDARREAAAGIGRQWAPPAPLGVGQVAVAASTAGRLGLTVGSVVVARLTGLGQLVRHALAPMTATAAASSAGGGAAPLLPPPLDAAGWGERALTFGADAAVPFTVAVVSDDATFGGKISSEEGGAGLTLLAEWAAFLPHLAAHVHPAIACGGAPVGGGSSGGGGSGLLTVAVVPNGSAAATTLPGAPLLALSTAAFAHAAPPPPDAFADEIVASMAPRDRVAAYSQANFDRVRASVAAFGSSLLFVAGFSEAAAGTPLVDALEGRRFISLYLSLVLDILLIILFALSVILVYSLLLLNVEGRTFEVAVRRMLGTTRGGIVGLLLVQAAAYAVPSWVGGLALGQAIAAGLLAGFSRLASIPVPLELTPGAIGSATALAVAIPALSSIGPIRGALGRSIREALDPDRPKAPAVRVTINRATTAAVSWRLVALGLGIFAFGFLVYFAMPLAFITLNLSLLMSVFLVILVGLLAGLVLLGIQAETALQWVTLAALVRWWEAPAVAGLAWTNLSAGHRDRNRKTSLMYALSVAFIVFVTIVASGQVQTAVYAAKASAGASLVLSPPGSPGAGGAGRLGADGSYPSPPDPLSHAALEAVVAACAAGSGGTTLSAAAVTVHAAADGGADVATVGFLTAPLPHLSLGYYRFTSRAPGGGGANTTLGALAFLPLPARAAADPVTPGAVAGQARLPRVLHGSGWAVTRLDAAVRAITAAGASAWSEGGVLVPAGAAVTTAPTAAAGGGVAAGTPAWSAPAGAIDASLVTGASLGDVYIRSRGRTAFTTVTLQGVSPSLLGAADPATAGGGWVAAAYTQFVEATASPPVSETALSLTALLATARGGQTALIGASSSELILTAAPRGTAVLDSEAALALPLRQYLPGGNTSSAGRTLPRFLRSPLSLGAALAAAPGFAVARTAALATASTDAVLVSVPTAVRLLDRHVSGGGIPRPPVAAVGRLWRRAAGTAVAARMAARRARADAGWPTAAAAAAAPPPLETAAGAWRHPAGARAHVAQTLYARLADSLSGSGSGGGGGGVTSATFGLATAPREPPSAARHLYASVSLSDAPLNRQFLSLGDDTRVSRGARAAVLTGLQSALTAAARARTGDPTSDDTAAGGGWDTTDAAGLGSDSDTTVQLLQLLFGGLALVAMALCAFALLANMIANVAEQTREVGVLRALGLKPRALVRLYVEEAFVLVLVASLLGVGIGCLVA